MQLLQIEILKARKRWKNSSNELSHGCGSKYYGAPNRCTKPNLDKGKKMDKFTSVSSVAAPLPLINIDTDMIIPKQFLKTIKRSGLGKLI